jgi:hypothetical protein
MDRYLEYNHLALIDSTDTIKGRCVQTDRHLPKGTVIITSQPLGTVALPQTLNECCNYCFRKQVSPPLQRCSQCKKAYFCDMACFKNAWLSYHQYVCKNGSSTRHAEDDMDLEMLERVALNVARYRKRINTNKIDPVDGSDETVEVTMEAFFSLMGHDQLQQRHVKEQHALLAKEALQKPFIAQQTDLTVDELIHYLNVFKSNNFSIDDTDMFAIGEGTYPIAALFNHSCRPNAVVMFDGALASIHAIEDIEPHTEITIAYVDAAHSRSFRQKSLREKYFFDCTCERCVPNVNRPYLSKVDTLLGQEESEWDRAQDILNEGSTIDKRARILKQIEEWDLLEMCKIYDRKSNGIPNPNEPLSIAHYTHYFIQFFAPYLLTWNQPDLHQQQAGLTVKTSLTDFDDPLPALAKPMVQSTYDEIMETAINTMLSYPTDPSTIVPYRLTTLSTCTRLFYDEMAEGHWQNAVKLGMYVLIQYCLIYSPYHPMLAQLFLTLAKACWNSIIQSELINDNLKLDKVYERGVRRWVMSSKETIAVAFGKHSKLWRETLELEWIFLREQKLK